MWFVCVCVPCCCRKYRAPGDSGRFTARSVRLSAEAPMNVWIHSTPTTETRERAEKKKGFCAVQSLLVRKIWLRVNHSRPPSGTGWRGKLASGLATTTTITTRPGPQQTQQQER